MFQDVGGEFVNVGTVELIQIIQIKVPLSDDGCAGVFVEANSGKESVEVGGIGHFVGFVGKMMKKLLNVVVTNVSGRFVVGVYTW